MSKKGRQWVTIVGLCVLLIAAGIGYYAASVHQKNKSKQETAETDDIILYSMEKETISEIHLTNTSMDLTLKKKDGQWVDASDAEFPVNQDNVNSILSTVSEVRASKLVVENPDDLAQYDLEKPTYLVEIKSQDGQTQTLAVGLESIAAEGCYAYVGTASKIYTVASTITDDLSYTRGQMMTMPEALDITASYVTGFSMKAAKGKSFEAVYDKKNAKFADVDGWDITKPYCTAVAGDKEALESLFGGLSSLECVEGVEYQSTRKLLKQYGLLNPAYQLIVNYYTVEEETDGSEETEDSAESEGKKTAHKLQLSVGAKDDTEENYYVSIAGQKGIYLMSVDTIDALVQINAFDYVSKYIHRADLEAVKRISITKQGKTHVITISRKVIEDAIAQDGGTAYNYTIKLDGKKVDSNTFQDTYASVFGDLTYHSEINAKKAVANEKADAVMTIETESRKTTVRFLPYDKNHFYRVEMDGQSAFLVDINVVNNTIKELLALK